MSGLARRGGMITGAGFALTQVITLAGALAIGNLISVEDFGVFAAGALFANFATVFAESGLHSALVQWRGDEEEAANSVLLATIASGAGLTLLAIALAPVIGWIFGNDLIEQVAFATSGILLLRAASVTTDALMQRRFAFNRQIIVQPAMALSYAIVAILLLRADKGVWALVIALYVSQGLAVLLSWGLARWRPRPRLASIPVWRDLARFGQHTLFARVVAGGRDELETVVVGASLGEGPLGLFRFARRLTNLPGLAAVNIGGYVLLPVFSRIAEDLERLRAAYLRSLRWITAMVFPLAFGLLALGPSVVHVVLPERWEPMGVALAIMFAFGVGESLISVSVEASRAAGRPELASRLGLVVLIVGSAFVLAAIPFGLNGFALAVSLSAAVAGAYAVYGACRRIGLRVGLAVRAVAPQLAAALTAAVVTWLCDRYVGRVQDLGRLDGLWVLLAEVGIGLLVYAIALVAFAPGAGGVLRQLSERVRRADR